MRHWIRVCGGPASLGGVGFLLLGLVEHLHVGTYWGMFRVEVLYGSLIAFTLSLVWAIHNLWMVLKASHRKGDATF